MVQLCKQLLQTEILKRPSVSLGQMLFEFFNSLFATAATKHISIVYNPKNKMNTSCS